MENSIHLAHSLLPTPFKEFNENNGKKIYDSLLYKPSEDAKKEDDSPKSIMILHLAGNTSELIELIEKNKTFLLKSGHMTLDDKTMIIEILFEHLFKQDKIYQANTVKLFKLIKEFIELNYHKLSLTLDWRPCFNTIFAIYNNNEVLFELYSLAGRKEDFSGIMSGVLNKLSKFFPQGSALEMFNEIKSELFLGNPKFFTIMNTFSLLVPTKRYNTDEDEIQEWLPFIINLWKTLPGQSNYKASIMKLLAQVTQHFNRVDFTHYDNWVLHQLNLVLTESNQGAIGNQKKAEYIKYFAQYFVNTYKSKAHQNSEESKGEQMGDHVGTLAEKYSDFLHPSNKFKNKGDLIGFIHSASTSL